jgi:hypothetical protein
VRIEVVPYGGVSLVEPEFRTLLGDLRFQKDVGAVEDGSGFGEQYHGYDAVFESANVATAH